GAGDSDHHQARIGTPGFRDGRRRSRGLNRDAPGFLAHLLREAGRTDGLLGRLLGNARRGYLGTRGSGHRARQLGGPAIGAVTPVVRREGFPDAKILLAEQLTALVAIDDGMTHARPLPVT